METTDTSGQRVSETTHTAKKVIAAPILNAMAHHDKENGNALNNV